jgi:hypothetical protein
MNLLLISLAFASPVNDSIIEYNKLSYYDLPTLTDSQLDTLEKDKILQFIDSGDGVDTPRRGVCFYQSDSEFLPLWLSYSDPHFTLKSNFRFELIKKIGVDKMVWYGHLDLPWPVDDRHWITLSWNNHHMAKVSHNKMWEHPWELDLSYESKILDLIRTGKIKDLTEDAFKSSIFLPESKGAFALIRLEERTLVIYHSTGTIGGLVPDELMIRFLMRSMEELLTGIDQRSVQRVPRHYKSPHTMIYGGDGIQIPHLP